MKWERKKVTVDVLCPACSDAAHTSDGWVAVWDEDCNDSLNHSKSRSDGPGEGAKAYCLLTYPCSLLASV